MSQTVKPGYKQTEVGVIPEEWEAVPLKGKVSIAHGFAFASEHFAGHGPYRLATPGHFYEAGGFRDIGEKQKYYVGPVPSDYVLKPGDVIVAMTEQADGLLGSAAVIPEQHGYLHNQRLGRVKVLSSDIQLDYLVYVFNSPSYRAKVRETAAGTKVKHTSPEKLLEISVRMPPLPEQRAIASALSDVDALLAALDRLIAKQRDLKQAAMQQLLTGQTRLPGFKGKWETKTLHDVCQKIQDGTHFSPKLGGNDYLYVTSKNIRFGMLDMSTAERISAAEHFKIYARCDVKKGDLLLTKDGANTGNAALNPMDEPFSLLSSVAMLRFDSRNHSAAYFMYQILSNFGQMQIKDAMSGNAITRLTLQKIRALRFSVAPLPEQTAIATVLSDMDLELAALEQRRDKTRALKQGMMQELLTGRTRLV